MGTCRVEIRQDSVALVSVVQGLVELTSMPTTRQLNDRRHTLRMSTTAGHEDIRIGTVFLMWPQQDGTQLDGDSHSDTGHECDPDFRLEEEGMFGVEVADRIFSFTFLRPIHLDAFNQFRLHESIPKREQPQMTALRCIAIN